VAPAVEVTARLYSNKTVTLVVKF